MSPNKKAIETIFELLIINCQAKHSGDKSIANYFSLQETYINLPRLFTGR